MDNYDDFELEEELIKLEMPSWREIPICIHKKVFGYDLRIIKVDKFLLEKRVDKVTCYYMIAEIIRANCNYDKAIKEELLKEELKLKTTLKTPHICWPWGIHYKVTYLSDEGKRLNPVRMNLVDFHKRLDGLLLTKIDDPEVIEIHIVGLGTMLEMPKWVLKGKDYPYMHKVINMYQNGLIKAEVDDEIQPVLWEVNNCNFYDYQGELLLPPGEESFIYATEREKEITNAIQARMIHAVAEQEGEADEIWEKFVQDLTTIRVLGAVEILKFGDEPPDLQEFEDEADEEEVINIKVEEATGQVEALHL